MGWGAVMLCDSQCCWHNCRYADKYRMNNLGDTNDNNTINVWVHFRCYSVFGAAPNSSTPSIIITLINLLFVLCTFFNASQTQLNHCDKRCMKIRLSFTFIHWTNHFHNTYWQLEATKSSNLFWKFVAIIQIAVYNAYPGAELNRLYIVQHFSSCCDFDVNTLITLNSNMVFDYFVIMEYIKIQ